MTEFDPEEVGATIFLSQEEEWSAGLLGATIRVPRGSRDIGTLLNAARLEEIERRILQIEARLTSGMEARRVETNEDSAPSSDDSPAGEAGDAQTPPH